MSNLHKLLLKGRVVPMHCKGKDGAWYVVGFKRKATSKKSHHVPEWLRNPIKCAPQLTDLQMKAYVVILPEAMPPRVTEYFIKFTTPLPEESLPAVAEDTKEPK